jgi:hypothetical protein
MQSLLTLKQVVHTITTLLNHLNPSLPSSVLGQRTAFQIVAMIFKTCKTAAAGISVVFFGGGGGVNVVFPSEFLITQALPRAAIYERYCSLNCQF